MAVAALELYGLDQALLYTRHDDGHAAAAAAERERSEARKGSKKGKAGKRRRSGGR